MSSNQPSPPSSEEPHALFDAHFHIIDKRFPLVPNNGFLPETFTTTQYLKRVERYHLCGGTLVSGSFQAFDQSYLIDALSRLGPSFVGVTQLPVEVSDDELRRLNKSGIRGLRFNLRRGGSEEVKHLDRMARRVHEIVGWHVELYVDSNDLSGICQTLLHLPAVCVDHLGLSGRGMATLLKLVDHGVSVKATGFGRVDFDIPSALRTIFNANPNALMFGTDLPSTRAPRPYSDDDVTLITNCLGEEKAKRVLYRNAMTFYNIAPRETNEIER